MGPGGPGPRFQWVGEEEHVERIFRLAKVRYAVMTNIPYVEDVAAGQPGGGHVETTDTDGSAVAVAAHNLARRRPNIGSLRQSLSQADCATRKLRELYSELVWSSPRCCFPFCSQRSLHRLTLDSERRQSAFVCFLNNAYSKTVFAWSGFFCSPIAPTTYW